MSATNTLALILVVAAVTQVTRWLPFWLFGGRQPPPWVVRLGKALPPAVMAALVVYCLRAAPFSLPGQAAAALISAALVAVIQWRGENTLISVALGTGLYMLLIRVL